MGSERDLSEELRMHADGETLRVVTMRSRTCLSLSWLSVLIRRAGGESRRRGIRPQIEVLTQEGFAKLVADNLSQEEAAAKLGLSRGAFRKLLKRSGIEWKSGRYEKRVRGT